MARRVRKNQSRLNDGMPENDGSDVEVDYNFESEGEHERTLDNFENDWLEEEEGEEEGAEEEEEEEEGREGTVTYEDFAWDRIVGTEREDKHEDEKYGDVFYEEEEAGEEGEEMQLSLTASETEKFDEEVRQVEESDHVLGEIPGEDAADRDAIISRIKELRSEQRSLRRKNKLLELWVYRHMKKTEQKMTPADINKDTEQIEHDYREALRAYKHQIDEIMTQQAELKFEVHAYTDKVRIIRDEDEHVFNEFLERVREVAVGLVYAKTGRKITEKIINQMIRRQTSRRRILARDRRNYIRLQHRLEDIHERLRNLETLGEGMTTMDYEALRIANISHKDKLDERDGELEKLRFKIAEVANAVAHYKEKEVCLVEDIEYEEQLLKEYLERAIRIRECVNSLHVIRNDLRETYNEKKIDAGLLIAPAELREMERMMKLRDVLKNDIEILEHEIRQLLQPHGRKKRSKASSGSTIPHDESWI